MSSVHVCRVVPYLEGHSFHSDSMDSASDTGTTAVTFNEHLTFPSAESDAPEPPTNALPQPRLLLKDRLYVGNLHPTVDEYVCQVLRFINLTASRYALLQVFSKFGKITKLDFLFHKTGALKGKPRGYAFIEYGEQAVSSVLAPYN
jgi:RNA recognition motif-containing protein